MFVDFTFLDLIITWLLFSTFEKKMLKDRDNGKGLGLENNRGGEVEKGTKSPVSLFSWLDIRAWSV